MDPPAKYAPFKRIWYFDPLRTWRPVGLERALLANALIAGCPRKNSIASRRAGHQVALTRGRRVLTFRSKIDCFISEGCCEVHKVQDEPLTIHQSPVGSPGANSGANPRNGESSLAT